MIEKLRNLSNKFRCALEGFSGIENPKDEYEKDINLRLNNFPDLSCSEVTQFLGHYLLFDNGITPLKQCMGNYKPTWGFHIWLQHNDILIDITADQFEDNNDKVIVTNNSTFHKKNFDSLKISDGLFDFVHWNDAYKKYYKLLIEYLNNNCT